MSHMIICIISSNLDSIPDGHEREADKEAEGASDVCDQGDQWVDENLYNRREMDNNLKLHTCNFISLIE